MRPDETKCGAKSIAHETYSSRAQIGPIMYLVAIQREIMRNLCARPKKQKLKGTEWKNLQTWQLSPVCVCLFLFVLVFVWVFVVCLFFKEK